MKLLTRFPSFSDLNRLATKVRSYPVSAGQLTTLAAHGSNSALVDFYRHFPSDLVFTDKEDLITRSVQVETLSREEEEQPKEEFLVPEED